MKNLLKQIKYFYSSYPKSKLTILFISSAILSVMEFVSVISIVPLLQILYDESIIEGNKYLSALYQYLRAESPKEFFIYLSVIVLVITVMRSLVVSVSKYYIYKYSLDVQYIFAKRLLESYLMRPYPFFIANDSSQLFRNVQYASNFIVSSFFVPIMEIFLGLMVISIIFILLLRVNITLTLGMLLVGMLVFFFLTFVVRKRISRMSAEKDSASSGLFHSLNQLLQGIKDIKILNRENYFYGKFSASLKALIDADRRFFPFSVVPSIIMQALIVILPVFVLLYLVTMDTPKGEVISLIGYFGVSLSRIMPNLNTITTSINRMKYHKFAIDLVYEELTAPRESAEPPGELAQETLPFEKKIEINGLYFKYPETNDPVLNNLNLHIEKNSSNAIIGTSGAGKTTFVDLMMGLFTPEAGQIIVDGKSLDVSNMARWRKQIGYIPQTIFLHDGTIASNIAFGIDEDKIDLDQIRSCLEVAQLTDFVDTLPEGVQTTIGERGVKLSGGQRQRVGIARAFYSNPDILILDEATSALDNLTESEIVNEIDQLAGQKTLIVIAHRLSTVEHCDKIHMLDKGKVIASGTYHELLETNKIFQNLVNVHNLKKKIPEIKIDL